VSDDLQGRMIGYWTGVDANLAARVAAGLGCGAGRRAACGTDSTRNVRNSLAAGEAPRHEAPRPRLSPGSLLALTRPTSTGLASSGCQVRTIAERSVLGIPHQRLRRRRLHDLFVTPLVAAEQAQRPLPRALPQPPVTRGRRRYAPARRQHPGC
jgi:hypothetical protein